MSNFSNISENRPMERIDIRWEFSTEAVLNEEKTKTAKRPMFDAVDYYRAVKVGEKNKTWSGPVKHVMKNRDLWEAGQGSTAYSVWKETQDAVPIDGYPIEAWGYSTPFIVKQCKSFEVRTVEELSRLTDSQCSNIGAKFLDLRRKAKAFVEEQRRGPDYATVVADMEQREMLMQMELEERDKQISELTARLKALETATAGKKASA